MNRFCDTYITKIGKNKHLQHWIACKNCHIEDRRKSKKTHPLEMRFARHTITNQKSIIIILTKIELLSSVFPTVVKLKL